MRYPRSAVSKWRAATSSGPASTGRSTAGVVCTGSLILAAAAVDVVGDMEQVEVVGADRAGAKRRLAQPREQPGPVRGPDQDDREAGHLVRLDQGEGLEELVEGAETTGKDDEAILNECERGEGLFEHW